MNRSVIAVGALSLALVSVAGAADAQSIIRQNDAHPHFEIEPHALIGYGFLGGFSSFGVGGGIRFGIPIVPSGFLSGVNDSFAISVGGDFLYVPNYGPYNGLGELIGHADAQWNFFLTEKWSVFGELGVAPRFYFGNFNGLCGVLGCGSVFGDWLDFAVGARFHFRGGAQFPTLTLRGGTAGLTVGVSF